MKLKVNFINTAAGQLAVYTNDIKTDKTPVIFLHGVYFDHNLWENQISEITDRTVLAVDMPLHGESKSNIKSNWTLDDCVQALLEILNQKGIMKSIAIGHSWGSMTILQAAAKNPHLFEKLILCNMPYKELTKKEKNKIKLVHRAMFLKQFYMKQAAKALFGKENLKNNPDLIQKLIVPMSKLSNREIKYIDYIVRIKATDSGSIIKNLSVPAIAIIGDEDYVGVPPAIETITLNCGHVSPLERPDDVNKIIKNSF